MSPTTKLVPMSEIRKASSGHFFEPATTRFFQSRIARHAVCGPGGTFFVSSERQDGGARRYTIRQVHPSGRITTSGDFRAFALGSEATAAARKLAEGATEVA